ncbi:hypothetical protein SAY86_030029 [Trapa natans]|uniref:Uncharacterized protein n=1 Tax=Trapa natans TaxID=22666 RepID=A0AAN7RHY7_TRANT|nr:hypothetical protein SAY86_030029 [Trapa natans]
MRLITGSLRNQGVRSYKEFEIPKGINANPYVKRLGHFSMAVESIAPAPTLKMSLALTPTNGGRVAVTNARPPSQGKGKSSKIKIGIIVECVIGTLVILTLLGLLVLWTRKIK